MALRAMKKGDAAGDNGITAATLCHGWNIAVAKLSDLFSQCLVTLTVPAV